jgi:hypothetical protein
VWPEPLSCSIGDGCFPVPTWRAKPRRAAEGIGRSGATRSHAQRALAREDGEHRTFPDASTVARSSRSRTGRSIEKRYVTKSGPRTPAPRSGAVPAQVILQRQLRPQTPFDAPAQIAMLSPGAVASAAARRGRRQVELVAAARTIRATPAMVRTRTTPAPALSPSSRGRDAAARAESFFGSLVGRTSPSCYAVRSPDRNCSSVDAVGAAARPRAG